MKLTLIILSKLINNFDTFEKEIYSINITIKNYCDELSNHYYEKSEDYIKNEISRNNDLAEFYEQNPDNQTKTFPATAEMPFSKFQTGSHTFSDNPHHKPVRPSLFSEFLPFPIILPSVADPNL